MQNLNLKFNLIAEFNSLLDFDYLLSNQISKKQKNW